MMRNCEAWWCLNLIDTGRLCSTHYQQLAAYGRFVPTRPEEIPPVCICDIPIPDAIGQCADCLRPYKPRFAQLREAWREFYRIRGWELNMLEEAA